MTKNPASGGVTTLECLAPHRGGIFRTSSLVTGLAKQHERQHYGGVDVIDLTTAGFDVETGCSEINDVHTPIVLPLMLLRESSDKG